MMRKQERHVNRYLLALLTSLALSGQVAAVDEQPREEGIEGKDYVWNEMQGEKLQALRAKGDALRGEIEGGPR